MTATRPLTELDPRFSTPGATPAAWAEARDALTAAEVFWLSTVRPDGRPHVTPLIAVLLDDVLLHDVLLHDALVFTTGARERKARNLAADPRVVLTTGTNALGHGLDIVVEGTARRVREGAFLERVARAYRDKYGEDWAFTPRDGELHHEEGGAALAYAVAPEVAFGFRKGAFSQTRWRFSTEAGDGTA
ncbi:pyridoxamine 5'-phosphate oxidase family protein [Streptomyces marincola]|uniref:pyridoxamine 5'-phosphate oxidase family protein n=1 Tax=Streptomyces marincola TaxID=2878388 RepID=UPI001CF43820|nr:pyridoxamine 5'-phosphate oxidase family protein [Streptomyces marincola]UCM88558.1 pyridoxamine 5'-phosphate oxidase family protein [Streptomyces marincola]